MRGCGWLILGILAFFCGSVAAQTQTICGVNQPIPAGWTVISSSGGDGQCGNIGSSTAAIFTIKRYDNLPIGFTLDVCKYSSPVLIPPGWSFVSEWYGGGVCGPITGSLASNVVRISHTSCVNQDPNTCNPPSPTGQLSTSASSVVVPYGQSAGSVNVSWATANTNGSCVWQSTSGAAPALWSCGGTSGSGVWPYVPPGGNTKFILTTNGSSPSPVLATKTVTGIAGAQPTLKLVPKYNLVQTGPSSGNVLIPATASPTSGPFTFSWNGPGYPSLDLQGQVNGGAWLSPLNIPASGSSDQPISLGTTYTYRLLPHGATSPILATLSVSGVAAPAPTFSINPAHVVVPPGSNEGSFTFTWNAPGYESLDLAGQVNGGAWGAPFAISKSGSSTQPIPVGTTYNYRFYPPGDTVHIIGTLSVSASR